MGLLLNSDTSELRFEFGERRQLSSSIRLRNPTENHVAFKFLCTRPRRYAVQPWIGILSPGESCEVTVTTQARRRAPTNMQTWHSKDTFMIRSVFARPGTTKEDAPNLFNTVVAHMIEESRLRVVYTLPPALDTDNSTKSSLATTSKVDESRSIVEVSASQVVYVSGRGWRIHIGALILTCFICTFIVASYYLTEQTCSLIWTFTKSMVMFMMKMFSKLVSESIEDWVAKTLFCVFMSLVCKYKEWLSISLHTPVFRVMDLTNWKTKLIQMLTNWKDKMIKLLDFS